MKRGRGIFFIVFLFIFISSFILAQDVEVDVDEEVNEELVIAPSAEEGLNVVEEETETDEALAELPEPGILPTSPLYGIKTAFQNLRLALSRNEAKERYRLRLLDLRLAELNKLQELSEEWNATGRNTEKIEARIEKLTERYDKQLEKSEESVEKLKALGRNVTILREHVANMTRKHILVLKRVSEKVPIKAKTAILRTINKSVTGYENAVSAVLEEKGLTENEVKELLSEARERYRERIINRTAAQACIQVITQAYDAETGDCKIFASPCDVPEGWVRKSCKVEALKEDIAAIKQNVTAFRKGLIAVRKAAITATKARSEVANATINITIGESTKISEGVAQQQQQTQTGSGNK